MSPVATKYCSGCRCQRAEILFSPLASGKPSRRCNPCRAAKERWHGKNKDRVTASIKNARARSPRYTLNLALWHARKRAEVSITTDDLVEMFNRQGGKCALSGIEMTWAKGKRMPTSISIDQIKAGGGYHLNNVRLVCAAINAFKETMSDEEMIAMAKAIINHHS